MHSSDHSTENKRNNGAKKRRAFPLFKYLFGNRNEISLLKEEQIASPWRTVLRSFVSNRVSMGALIVFVLIVLVLVVTPFFYPVDLSYSEAEQANLPPGFGYMDLPEAMKDQPRSIAVGPTFGIGADKNGQVHVWGLTKLFAMPELKEIPEEAKDVVQVAAGFDHVLALTKDGKLLAWGNKRLQQTRIPREITRLKNIKEIYASYQFSAVLTEDGQSYVFGNVMNIDYNQYHPFQGQLKKLALGTDVVMGLSREGEAVYLGSQANAYSRVPEGKGYTDIAAAARAFTLIGSDGQFKAWGNLTFKGEGNYPSELGAKPVSLSAGQYHFAALLEDGRLVTWGNNALQQTKIPQKLSAGRYNKVISAYYQNYLIDQNGRVESFGHNGYLLGTDDFGRDIFGRILNGGRLTLTIGSVAVIIATLIGSFLGGVSGFFGGKVDMFLQRFGEIVNSLPFLPTVIILNSIIGNALSPTQRVYLIMVILGFLSWVELMRLIRAQVLSLREQEFVVAARAMGIKELGIVFRHIIPNVISIIIVSATLSFAGSLLTESTLSFLGFGVQPPQPTWGNMLTGANNSTVIQSFWWRWVYPSIILSVCVICINLIGTGLDDAIDPKSQER